VQRAAVDAAAQLGVGLGGGRHRVLSCTEVTVPARSAAAAPVRVSGRLFGMLSSSGLPQRTVDETELADVRNNARPNWRPDRSETVCSSEITGEPLASDEFGREETRARAGSRL
jgi:hypothetical protein